MYPMNAFILQTRNLRSGEVKDVYRNLNLLSCRESYTSFFLSLYTHRHTHTHPFEYHMPDAVLMILLILTHLTSSTILWASQIESACQCRSYKTHRFDPWVWKIPWRRAW